MIKSVIYNASASMAILLFLSFSGCSHETKIAKVPMDMLHYEKTVNGTHRELFVFLPGRDDEPNAFEKNGFIDAVRNRGLGIDMIAADAHTGYYMNKTLLQRLKKDIIEPAKASGYQKIWLVGISMGGLGSLLYAREHPEDIEGVVLIGPFLGEDELIAEINKAGIEKWSRGIPKDDWQRKLWLWLKEYEERKRHSPIIYLCYGSHDKYSSGDRLLAKILPEENVITVMGGHYWHTWTKLWDLFLDRVYRR